MGRGEGACTHALDSSALWMLIRSIRTTSTSTCSVEACFTPTSRRSCRGSRHRRRASSGSSPPSPKRRPQSRLRCARSTQGRSKRRKEEISASISGSSRRWPSRSSLLSPRITARLCVNPQKLYLGKVCCQIASPHSLASRWVAERALSVQSPTRPYDRELSS